MPVAKIHWTDSSNFIFCYCCLDVKHKWNKQRAVVHAAFNDISIIAHCWLLKISANLYDITPRNEHGILMMIPTTPLRVLFQLSCSSHFQYYFEVFTNSAASASPTDVTVVMNMYISQMRHYHNILLLDGCIPRVWRVLFWVHAITIFLANLIPCQALYPLLLLHQDRCLFVQYCHYFGLSCVRS